MLFSQSHQSPVRQFATAASKLLAGAALVVFTSSAGAPQQVAPFVKLTLNGTDVPTSINDSRFDVSGRSRVLTLNIVRADSPDEPGLTILVDEFKPQPGIYRFKEILSGHVREAAYRANDISGESKACSVNDGEVHITAVDEANHTITGTFRAAICQTNTAPKTSKRLVFAGAFHNSYEVR
jgi:hypothetical protein